MQPKPPATPPASPSRFVAQVFQQHPPELSQSNVMRGDEGRTDAPGVISLIFGILGSGTLAVGCLFSCVGGFVLYPVAALFAASGLVLGFFARGNLRVAGVVLNTLTLIPAVVMFVMLLIGVLGTAAVVAEKVALAPTPPVLNPQPTPDIPAGSTHVADLYDRAARKAANDADHRGFPWKGDVTGRFESASNRGNQQYLVLLSDLRGKPGRVECWFVLKPSDPEFTDLGKLSQGDMVTVTVEANGQMSWTYDNTTITFGKAIKRSQR